MSACEKSGKWAVALALLANIENVSLAPDLLSYSAAVSACEKGGQWQRALVVPPHSSIVFLDGRYLMQTYSLTKLCL